MIYITMEDVKTMKRSESPAETLVHPKDARMRGLQSQIINVAIPCKDSPNDVKITFPLHKGLLAQESRFFASLFPCDDDEPTSETVPMPTEDPDIFGMFAYWLYFRDLAQTTVTPDSEKPAKFYNPPLAISECFNDTMKLSFAQIYSVYLFAVRRGVPNLQDVCINAWRQRIVETQDWTNAMRGLTSIWTAVPPSNKFRRFIVKACAWAPRDRCDWLDFDTLPSEFPLEVLRQKMSGLIFPAMNALNQSVSGQSKRKSDGALVTPRPAKDQKKDEEDFAKMRLCEFHEHSPSQGCGVRGR